jgi:hypothetical protein
MTDRSSLVAVNNTPVFSQNGWTNAIFLTDQPEYCFMDLE